MTRKLKNYITKKEIGINSGRHFLKHMIDGILRNHIANLWSLRGFDLATPQHAKVFASFGEKIGLSQPQV